MRAIAFFFLLLISSQAVLAHTLKVNGTIGGVIHLEPDDEPISGQPTTIYLGIKDTSSKFSFKGCDCEIRFFLGKQIVNRQPIFSETLRYNFEQPGIYTLEIKGASLNNSFQNFVLSYDYYVRPGSTQAEVQGENKLMTLFPFVLIGAGLLMLILMLSSAKVEKK